VHVQDPGLCLNSSPVARVEGVKASEGHPRIEPVTFFLLVFSAGGSLRPMRVRANEGQSPNVENVTT
jgi:hypothetical protein